MAISRVQQLDAGVHEIFDQHGSRTGILILGADSKLVRTSENEIFVEIAGMTHVYDAHGQFLAIR